MSFLSTCYVIFVFLVVAGLVDKGSADGFLWTFHACYSKKLLVTVVSILGMPLLCSSNVLQLPCLIYTEENWGSAENPGYIESKLVFVDIYVQFDITIEIGNIVRKIIIIIISSK